jgi:hypothetical protein
MLEEELEYDFAQLEQIRRRTSDWGFPADQGPLPFEEQLDLATGCSEPLRCGSPSPDFLSSRALESNPVGRLVEMLGW